jgi:bifunctional enzyme CysN/CysC
VLVAFNKDGILRRTQPVGKSDDPPKTGRGAPYGDPVAGREPSILADQFEVMIFWMGEEPMLRGRTYLMHAQSVTVSATVAPLKYRLNLANLERVPATQLERSQVGVCSIELAEPLVFDQDIASKQTRGVILSDPATHQIVGAGLIRFALRRSQNVQWQALDIGKHARASAMNQPPCIIWLTGLSGSGKTTIANLVERRLHDQGRHTYLLDGDNVRHGLNKDLGFTASDRAENIRRVAEVAKLMVDAGLIVIVAFISPFANERQMARSLVGAGEFLEVHVDAPLHIAERRDPKGLYAKARRGELTNFTGIDSPYESPTNPDLRIDTTSLAPPDAAEAVIRLLASSGTLPA